MHTIDRSTRYSRLFELLRQQELAEATSNRLNRRMRRQVDISQALSVQAAAAASFRAQRLPGVRRVSL